MDASSSFKVGLKVEEVKLNCMRDDVITIPMFLNTTKEEFDTSWMVPISIFHSKCLGEAIEELWSFEEDLIKLGGVRQTTKSEMSWLIRHYYSPLTNKHYLLAPFKNLIVVCKSLEAYKWVEGLVACMEAKDPSITQGEVIQGEDPFPSYIPKFSLSSGDIMDNYSLTSTAHGLDGSMWEKQMKALKAFKSNPPISTLANVTKVGESTFGIMAKHLDGYIGFCKLHLRKEPTLDMVMEPSCFAKYISFLEVSLGGWCML